MYNFRAFQYIIQGPVEEMQGIIDLLLPSRNGVPNGSSFAITSEGPHGYRRVYLSEASYQTLKECGFIPNMFPVDTVE